MSAYCKCGHGKEFHTYSRVRLGPCDFDGKCPNGCQGFESTDPDTRPTIACPNPKCGHSIIIPPLLGEMGERHPKWQRVEPGTVIPAGQPFRIEYDEPGRRFTAGEYLRDEGRTPEDFPHATVFIDSSWRPPLVLPTEPTWGIAVVNSHHQEGPRIIGRFAVEERSHGRYLRWASNRSVDVTAVLDFIPLTDEQVARIEAAR